MTRIIRLLAVPAVGAYYYDDLTALQSRSIPLPERYTAAPATPGFRRVREVAEAVSVGLALDDNQVAWGDCVAVEFSGQAGRDPVFRAEEGLATTQRAVAPMLQGRELTSFRELAAEVDVLTESVEISRPLPLPQANRGKELSRRDLLTAPTRLLRPEGAQGQEDENAAMEWVTVERSLHTAIRYGVSQALLKAVALARGVTMAEVIADKWDLPLPDAPVPIHAQSGSERSHNADKMIVRRITSLPHALVDNIPEQLGEDGTELMRYARWLKARIQELGGSCAETDLSARVAVHVALATRPDLIMAKPGMGVDEGITLVQNEMARTLARIRAREK